MNKKSLVVTKPKIYSLVMTCGVPTQSNHSWFLLVPQTTASQASTPLYTYRDRSVDGAKIVSGISQSTSEDPSKFSIMTHSLMISKTA